MNMRAYVAEFVGTFTLIFVGVLAIVNGQNNLLGIALAHGLAIAVMVSATMAVSGGHLNPSVTLGALVAGKIDGRNAIGYIISQCLGALVAAGLLAVTLKGGTAAVATGTPALAPGVSYGTGIVLEAVTTFFLMFVIFGTGIDSRRPKIGGLAIGLTIALDILAIGPMTGGAMNPARHLGPALVSGNAHLIGQIWLYWVGPVIGAVAAALVYHHVLEAPAQTA